MASNYKVYGRWYSEGVREDSEDLYPFDHSCEVDENEVMECKSCTDPVCKKSSLQDNIIYHK